MKHKEEELKNVQEKDSSLELSKEEFVKSYNLRRKDNIPKMTQEKGTDKSKRTIKRDDEKEGTDGKLENTDVNKEHGSKDTEQKSDSMEIRSKSDNRKEDNMADDNLLQNKTN